MQTDDYVTIVKADNGFLIKVNEYRLTPGAVRATYVAFDAIGVLQVLADKVLGVGRDVRVS